MLFPPVAMARQLGNMGVEVVKMLTVRDDRNEISKAVGEAMSRAELVLVTGGLGPTKDRGYFFCKSGNT